MLKSFVKLLCAVALANAVLAQNVSITAPEPNANVVGGSNITVRVDRRSSLTGSTEVALVLGFESCLSDCPSVSDEMGNPFYIGPYNPSFHSDESGQYQNFTFTVPNWQDGPAQITLAYFYLLSAGQTPLLELAAVPINVVPSEDGQ